MAELEDRSKWSKICPNCMEGLPLAQVGATCGCGETIVRENDDRPDTSSPLWNSRNVGPSEQTASLATRKALMMV